MWAADAGVLEQLQELYSDIDDQIELGSAPAKAPRAWGRPGPEAGLGAEAFVAGEGREERKGLEGVLYLI